MVITGDVNPMTGTVMLETLWTTKRMDLLDLVSPFVLYAIAKTTERNEIVNSEKVIDTMKSFGYVDVPVAVVETICKRNKAQFVRKQKRYYLRESLDDIVNQIDSRRIECHERVVVISKALADYLSLHCKRHRKYTEKEAITILHSFFENNGLYAGLDRIEECNQSPKFDEEGYYVAKYIFEKKNDTNSFEYSYILELSKGFLLKSALYLQARNTSIISASYKNVEFYYDTPFILRLLGCCSLEEEKEAVALHCAVQQEHGRCFYYPHVFAELNSIMTAYQHSLENGFRSIHTLEGLNNKKYSSDDVYRFRKNLQHKLSTFGIFEKDTTPLITKENDCVDIEKLMPKEEIKEYIKGQIERYKETNLENDVNAALSIHRQRNGKQCTEIEKSVSVFVTTNIDFARAFNRYYKQNVNAEAFPVVLTSSFLAAITWVKSGKVDDLPEVQLLKNAYASMQPSEEVLQKFEQVLQKMIVDEKLTIEQATVLCTDHYVKKELSEASFENVSCIDENFIEKAQKTLKERYTLEVKNDNIEARNHERYERKQRTLVRAQEYANDAKAKYIRIVKTSIYFIIVTVFVFGIVGTIKNACQQSLSIFSVSALLISLLSIMDVFVVRKGFITREIERCANRYSTKVYEKKKEEYSSLEDL